MKTLHEHTSTPLKNFHREGDLARSYCGGVTTASVLHRVGVGQPLALYLAPKGVSTLHSDSFDRLMPTLTRIHQQDNSTHPISRGCASASWFDNGAHHPGWLRSAKCLRRRHPIYLPSALPLRLSIQRWQIAHLRSAHGKQPSVTLNAQAAVIPSHIMIEFYTAPGSKAMRCAFSTLLFASCRGLMFQNGRHRRSWDAAEAGQSGAITITNNRQTLEAVQQARILQALCYRHT